MKHILMVDDVTTNLKSAAEVLQPFYHLSMAKSGKQALNFLKKNRPDLILLDVMMPEMDGYETLEQIKLNPRTANIPIIFLTADTEHESEVRGLKMGALDFITKPFEADVMLGRIEKVLQMEDMRKNLLNSARKDVLTDLWKPESIEPEINSRLKYADDGAALILLDFDDFSVFTQDYGGSNADGVIIRFTDALKKIAVTDAILGRMEKDAFLYYVPYHLSRDEIRGLYLEITDNCLSEANLARGGGDPLTLSISIAFAPEHGRDFETLYHKLQMAMYHVKQSGKNSVHFYQGK